MLNKIAVAVAVAAALLAPATATFASDGGAAAESPHFANGQSIYGQVADANAATKTITLPTKRHLNVSYDETVRFVSGDRVFTWRFNGLGNRDVDLQVIAPKGFDAKGAMIHIDKDPTWRGSSR